MLGKGLCDFISWQLRFRNLFGEKGGRPHANETKTFSAKGKQLPHMKTTKPNRSLSVTGWALNQFTKPRPSRSSRYRARFAPAYPGYRDTENHQARIEPASPARHAMQKIMHGVRSYAASSADRTRIPGTPRQARIAPAYPARHAKRASRPSDRLRCRSQARPGCPAQERADCLPAHPSYAPGPRRPQPRGWSPRCRSGFRRTACRPR